MGSIMNVSCKNCGYDMEAFLGEGMDFFWDMIARDELQKIEKGEYGEEIQKEIQEFKKEHPNHRDLWSDAEKAVDENYPDITDDETKFSLIEKIVHAQEKKFCLGDIDPEKAVAICPDCGATEEAVGFIMRIWDKDAREYKYFPPKKYFRKCKKCGGNAEIFDRRSFFEGIYTEYHDTLNQFFCGVDLVAAKKGEYGKDIQKFLQKYPEGIIEKEAAFAICSSCGAAEHTGDFVMYLPKKGYVLRQKHFKKCEKCGGDAEIFDERSIHDAICPKCHEKIHVSFGGMWD